MAFKSLAEIMELAQARKKPKTVAVAAAENDHALEAVLKAKKDGVVDPILIGNKTKILTILDKLGESIEEGRIFDTPDDGASARKAVQLVNQGDADFLMKGALNTSDLLRAVLDKTDGLPHGKVVTQMSLVELPLYHKILIINDAAIIPYPTLEQKIAQIQAVTGALHTMGYGDDIKIGVLCAAETLNSKISESADAAELKRLNQAGEITGCIIEGPISLDIALSSETAGVKGFDSPVAGDADFLLFPNLAAANMCIKALTMFGGATTAGILLGASVPISLSSRAGSTRMKYSSLTIASTAVR